VIYQVSEGFTGFRFTSCTGSGLTIVHGSTGVASHQTKLSRAEKLPLPHVPMTRRTPLPSATRPARRRCPRLLDSSAEPGRAGKATGSPRPGPLQPTPAPAAAATSVEPGAGPAQAGERAVPPRHVQRRSQSRPLRERETPPPLPRKRAEPPEGA